MAINPDYIGVIGDSLTRQNGLGEGDISALLQGKGWTGPQTRVSAVNGRTIVDGSNTPTTEQTWNDWIADDFDPRVVVLNLGANNHNAGEAAWEADFDQLLATIGDLANREIYIFNLAFADPDHANTASFHTWLATYAATNGYNVIDWWQLQQDRVAATLPIDWKPDDATGRHMLNTANGYDLPNNLLADTVEAEAPDTPTPPEDRASVVFQELFAEEDVTRVGTPVTGSWDGGTTPKTLTLPSTPPAGRLLVCRFVSDSVISAPSGWQRFGTYPGGVSDVGQIARIADGVVNSITLVSAGDTAAVLEHFEGNVSSSITACVDQTAQSNSSNSSGTTGTTTQARELALAALGAGANESGQFSAPTNGFVEDADVQSPGGAGTEVTGGFFSRTLSATGTYSMSATNAAPNGSRSGCIVTYKAASVDGATIEVANTAFNAFNGTSPAHTYSSDTPYGRGFSAHTTAASTNFRRMDHTSGSYAQGCVMEYVKMASLPTGGGSSLVLTRNEAATPASGLRIDSSAFARLQDNTLLDASSNPITFPTGAWYAIETRWDAATDLHQMRVWDVATRTVLWTSAELSLTAFTAIEDVFFGHNSAAGTWEYRFAYPSVSNEYKWIGLVEQTTDDTLPLVIDFVAEAQLEPETTVEALPFAVDISTEAAASADFVATASDVAVEVAVNAAGLADATTSAQDLVVDLAVEGSVVVDLVGTATDLPIELGLDAAANLSTSIEAQSLVVDVEAQATGTVQADRDASSFSVDLELTGVTAGVVTSEGADPATVEIQFAEPTIEGSGESIAQEFVVELAFAVPTVTVALDTVAAPLATEIEFASASVSSSRVVEVEVLLVEVKLDPAVAVVDAAITGTDFLVDVGYLTPTVDGSDHETSTALPFEVEIVLDTAIYAEASGEFSAAVSPLSWSATLVPERAWQARVVP